MTSSENISTEVRQINAVVEYDPRSKRLSIKLDPANDKRAIEVSAVALVQNMGEMNQQEAWFERPSARRP